MRTQTLERQNQSYMQYLSACFSIAKMPSSVLLVSEWRPRKYCTIKASNYDIHNEDIKDNISNLASDIDPVLPYCTIHCRTLIRTWQFKRGISSTWPQLDLPRLSSSISPVLRSTAFGITRAETYHLQAQQLLSNHVSMLCLVSPFFPLCTCVSRSWEVDWLFPAYYYL